MPQKLIAYVVVFLILFFGCLKLLESSSLVTVSVDMSVEAGKVAVENAPRLTVVFEWAVAAIVALLITTSRLGDWAVIGLLKAWAFLLGRVNGTLNRATDGQVTGLDAVLEDFDLRIKHLTGRQEDIKEATDDTIPRLEIAQQTIVSDQRAAESRIAVLEARLDELESARVSTDAAPRVRSSRVKGGAA